MTTNHKNPRRPITREKLAHDIAKCVNAYLEKLKVGGQRNTNVSRADLARRRTRSPLTSPSGTCSSQGFITSQEHPGSPSSGTEFPLPPVPRDVSRGLPIRSYILSSEHVLNATRFIHLLCFCGHCFLGFATPPPRFSSSLCRHISIF